MPWWIPLLYELLKLLPKVIEWIKEHPLASRKEVVAAFPEEVKGMLKNLKEKRQGIGSPPSTV